MIEARDGIGCELFQQLVLWISTSMCNYRQGRHLLEETKDLLTEETEEAFERLMNGYEEEQGEMRRQIEQHRALLRQVRKRGGTKIAIRESYVNMYGGLVLELPLWLEEIEVQRAELVRLRRPERTAQSQLRLLRTSIERALTDRRVVGEIIAELRVEMGVLLLHNPLPLSQDEYRERLEEAISCFELALDVYTFIHYPLQYAKTCIYLGNALQQYGLFMEREEAIERAIASYKAVLWVYSFRDHREQWALVQTLLGSVYMMRNAGGRQENIAYALRCHLVVLTMVTAQTAPALWARVQMHLGDTYAQMAANGQHTYYRNAIECYRESLRVYTSAYFPREWADIHCKLAHLYQQLEAEGDAQKDKMLCCSIVCCEEVVKQVYTIDSYPVEYALVQLCLGNAHMLRPGGEKKVNLELALACYQKVLHVITAERYPYEYQQAMERAAIASEEYNRLREERAEHSAFSAGKRCS